MRNQATSERLQPSILDRLTDLNPESKSDKRNDSVLSSQRLREIIIRDLTVLLNTQNDDYTIDADRYPLASESVLFYGISNAAGSFSKSDRARGVANALEQALERYEPRIIKNTISVELVSEEQLNNTVLDFDIYLTIWSESGPVQLNLKPQIDVKTGKLKFE